MRVQRFTRLARSTPTPDPSGAAVFQQLEVDYCVGHPHRELTQPDTRSLNTVPILRMYGITAEGEGGQGAKGLGGRKWKARVGRQGVWA